MATDKNITRCQAAFRTSRHQSQADLLLYSAAAQRAALGSVLLDNSLMHGSLASLVVTDFAGSVDRTLYALMLELSEDCIPFDPVTLTQILAERGHLEQVEGAAYVGSLIEGAVPEPGLIELHVRTIRKFSHLRRLQGLAENLEFAISKGDADPGQLLQKLSGAVDSLKAVHDLDGDLLPVAPRDLSQRAEILTLSQVASRAVEWLWEPYLPIGMLSMLSGDPGAGKTFVSLAVAAAITSGRTPCTGGLRGPADILYLSVENSPEHVLRPRFDSLGGDPDHFHILRGSVPSGGGRGVPSRLSSVRLSDVPLLSDALRKTKALLVIVDPLQSYLGAEVDAHRSNETRPVMDGLSRLAEEHSCCILLVRHLGKAQTDRPIHRGLGSIDLSGAVRTELLAGCSPDAPEERALVQVKSNLGHFGPAVGYTIALDGTFRWTGESRLTASAILAPDFGDQTGAMAEARELLLKALASGPRLATDVQAEAVQEGVSKRTLKRAKKELRVLSAKSGMDGAWMWALSEGGQT